MKKNILLTIAVLISVIWTGCQKDKFIEALPEEPEIVLTDSVWTLTLLAVKEDGVATKGLAIGDAETEAATTSLLSIWKSGDVVKVFNGGTFIGTLTAEPDALDPHYATLSGEVTTAGIEPGVTTLLLLTPRKDWDYTSQVGKLLVSDDPVNSIEAKYNYTCAESVLVTGVSGSNITTGTAHFENKQSIYRMSFRFQNGGVGAKTPINTKSLTVSGSGAALVQRIEVGVVANTRGDISVTLDEATTSPFFVAICNDYANGNEEVFTFTVVDNDGATYRGTKTIPEECNYNGSFVSMKNATLTSRLDIPLSSTEVATVL